MVRRTIRNAGLQSSLDSEPVSLYAAPEDVALRSILADQVAYVIVIQL